MAKQRQLHKERYISQRTRKSGTAFQVYINYIDSNGDKQVFSETILSDAYETPSEALQAARIIRDEALKKIRIGYTMTSKPTVRECYEKEKDLFPISFKTQQRHNTTFLHAIDKLGLADVRIESITAADLQKCMTKYAETNSQGNVKDALSLWKRIYRIAQMEELPISDKTMTLQPIKSKMITVKRNVNITHSDFDRFCESLLVYGGKDGCISPQIAFQNQQTWYMLQIMLYTGLRPSETLALSKEDIHIDENSSYLIINKAIGSNSSESRVVIPTKTDSSVRQVPIPEPLKPILVNLMAWSNSNPLLADINGRPTEIDILSNHIRLVSKKSGIEFRSYMLRHLFSTDMFKEKVNPRVVQDLMGHTSQSMSLYYARSSEEDRIEAVSNRKMN